MKFKSEHRFAGTTLAQYEQLYFDEAFNTALCQAVGLQRTLLRRDETAGRIHREVRVAPEREVPGPVAKVIGSTRLEYTESVDYVLGSGRGTWSTKSSVMTEKVASSGTFAFAAQGESVLRTVEGEITVRLPFVGSVVEKFIVADVEKSYEKAAEFTRNWLARKS